MVAAAGSESNETVAITGATGLIGQRLVSKLASQGARVKVLTRNPSSAQAKFVGVRNVTFVGPSDWETSIAGCTAVVNLAGEPIANRWVRDAHCMSCARLAPIPTHASEAVTRRFA